MKFNRVASIAATLALTGAVAYADENAKIRIQLGGIPLPSYTGPLYYAIEQGC